MPVARRSDPTTSHVAARSVVGISRSQANILALFAERGPMPDGDLLDLYAQMVNAGDYPPLSVSGIRTRRQELWAAGKLIDTGERRLTPANRECVVWGIPA